MVTKIAKERNDELCDNFCAYMAQLVTDLTQLMFGNKSAVDGWMLTWCQGWALIGMHCVQWACFVWGKWYSLLPIMTLDRLFTWKIFEGSVMLEMFVDFLYEFVVCSMMNNPPVSCINDYVDTICITLSRPLEHTCT